MINLEEEDTLADIDDVNDEYETIYIDINLHHMLSSQLTVTPSIEHCDSEENPCLELAIIPTMLDVAPLVSYPPSLNDIEQDVKS